MSKRKYVLATVGALFFSILLGMVLSLLTSNLAAGLLLAGGLFIGTAGLGIYRTKERQRDALMRRDFRRGMLDLVSAVTKTAKSSEKAASEINTVAERLADVISTAVECAPTASIAMSQQRTGSVKGITKRTTSVVGLPIASDVKARKSLKQPALVRARLREPISGNTLRKWIEAKTSPTSSNIAAVDQELNQKFPYRSSGLPYSSEIVVAMIADDFTYYSFAPDYNVIRLSPSNWRTLMEKYQPTIFICESAWEGGSPDEHPWRGKIYASVRFVNENRAELLAIIDYCRKNGIPTVFWNKEDPIHFPDRANDFVRTATLFDTVFTTAEECIPLYLKDARALAADVLPFAVQPRIFNPIGARKQDNSAVFAGTWYSQYPHRNVDARKIFSDVLQNGVDLVIYDRNYGKGRREYAYPEEYQEYIRPAVSYSDTAKIYRQSKYSISLNTITDSPTMFARRAFEIAACGSVVLSNPSRGVSNFFGKSALFPGYGAESLADISDDRYAQLQRESLRVAYTNTYRHRAEKVLDRVGVQFESWFIPAQMVSKIRSVSEYEAALQYARTHEGLKGLLAITDSNSEANLQMTIMRRNDDDVVVISESDLAGNAVRTRSLLASPKIFFWDPAKRDKHCEDFDLLLAYSRFHDGPVVFSGSQDERFTFTPVVALHNVMADASDLISLVVSDHSRPAAFNL